jgi:hypothetical protein
MNVMCCIVFMCHAIRFILEVWSFLHLGICGGRIGGICRIVVVYFAVVQQ